MKVQANNGFEISINEELVSVSGTRDLTPEEKSVLRTELDHLLTTLKEKIEGFANPSFTLLDKPVEDVMWDKKSAEHKAILRIFKEYNIRYIGEILRRGLNGIDRLGFRRKNSVQDVLNDMGLKFNPNRVNVYGWIPPEDRQG